MHGDRFDEPREHRDLGAPGVTGQEDAEGVVGDPRGEIRVADRAEEHFGGVEGDLRPRRAEPPSLAAR